jgi:hypothetical protein
MQETHLLSTKYSFVLHGFFKHVLFTKVIVLSAQLRHSLLEGPEQVSHVTSQATHCSLILKKFDLQIQSEPLEKAFDQQARHLSPDKK